MNYVKPKTTVIEINHFQLLAASGQVDSPEKRMEDSMLRMEKFDTYRKNMPSDWPNIKHSLFNISYNVLKDKTVVCVQSDSFKKDILVGKNILQNIYLIPVASHGTLISSTCDDFSELLKVNEKVFSKPKEYEHILKVIYNSQNSLFSNYYFTTEQYIDRVYLNSYIPSPYSNFIRDGKMTSSILNRLCAYSQFALLFDQECLAFGLDNFSFIKDFALPALSIAAKCCAIADVDWGKVLDFNDSEISVDSSTANDNGLYNTNGQISFTGTESDHNGKPCSHDGCNCTSCYSGNWDPQHCNHCHHLCSEHN